MVDIEVRNVDSKIRKVRVIKDGVTFEWEYLDPREQEDLAVTLLNTVSELAIRGDHETQEQIDALVEKFT